MEVIVWLRRRPRYEATFLTRPGTLSATPSETVDQNHIDETVIVLGHMPVNAPHERAKRGRGGIYLIVVSTVGESAQFLNERPVPLTLD